MGVVFQGLHRNKIGFIKYIKGQIRTTYRKCVYYATCQWDNHAAEFIISFDIQQIIQGSSLLVLPRRAIISFDSFVAQGVSNAEN